jgi:salicylate 5-hydroxylase small subunit
LSPDDRNAAAGALAAGAAPNGRSLPIEPALQARIAALYADYGAALDERRYDDWVALFTDDCRYVLQPRENHERGLPLATMLLEGRGMLKDRVYGITHTLFHAPYYQRHVFGPPRLLARDDGAGVLHVEVSYAVFRTRLNQPSEVFSVGRHIDRLAHEPGGEWLLFADKRVVFDSETILNSVIYPV